MKTENKFPSEIVDLPSKGLLYSEDSPLKSGKLEMKYMTAKEEDILTNQNYIQRGIVIDKLLKALIVDKKINYSELLTGDKNALLVAARVLGYGKDYEFNYLGVKENVDLSLLENKKTHKDFEKATKNEFEYTLPTTNKIFTFKLLTHGDEIAISKEVQGQNKIRPGSNPEISTRLKYIITSIDGDSDKKAIREFVDNYLLARDSRALREEIKRISPDVELKYQGEDGEEDINIPIGLNFFWPDA